MALLGREQATTRQRTLIGASEKPAHSTYSEIANAATGLACIGFPPERLAKFVAKQTEQLKSRDEAKLHLP